MSTLRVNNVKDLAGIAGFTLSTGGITANATLIVGDITINGSVTGSSKYIIPNMSGQAGKFLQTDGTNLSWVEASSVSGFRSMQVWTSNGTWSKPSDCKTIMVTVLGAGGGGSGYCEAGGAGGMSQRVIDVQNVSSVSVTVGNPGGGTNYSGCGGNGNTSSFGGYCSASGGVGANCSQQHAGGYGGNGSGGQLNVHGGGGNGHGSHHSYGNYCSGVSYYGGGQPGGHNQVNWSHRHELHAAWGSGGNGSRHSNRGARGREGIVVVHEYWG